MFKATPLAGIFRDLKIYKSDRLLDEPVSRKMNDIL